MSFVGVFVFVVSNIHIIGVVCALITMIAALGYGLTDWESPSHFWWALTTATFLALTLIALGFAYATGSM